MLHTWNCLFFKRLSLKHYNRSRFEFLKTSKHEKLVEKLQVFVFSEKTVIENLALRFEKFLDSSSAAIRVETVHRAAFSK